jgi:acetyltransferase-like isoleucine patch superfamily enzyme
MTLTSIARGLRSPRRGWRVFWALARGWRLKLTSRRLRAGKNLRIFGKLHLHGPGQVVLGDNVTISMIVTPWTYSPEAIIEVGGHTFLNGTRFGCQRRISVGPYSILADCRIMDTNFHSISMNRHDPSAPVKVSPIEIAENVWVAAQAGILPGTTIGANSVVGFGAVCSGAYPANAIIAGNPAKVIGTVQTSGNE